MNNKKKHINKENLEHNNKKGMKKPQGKHEQQKKKTEK